MEVIKQEETDHFMTKIEVKQEEEDDFQEELPEDEEDEQDISNNNISQDQNQSRSNTMNNTTQQQTNNNNNHSNSQSNNERVKKRYSVITPEVRKNFIDRILQRQVTIRAAALEFGIKFSTAKAILQIFKKEGRYTKKQTRITKNKSKETMKLMPIVLRSIESTTASNNNGDNSNSNGETKVTKTTTYTVDQEMKKTMADLVQFLDENSLYIPLKSGDSKIFKYNTNLYSNITINNHLNPFKNNDFNTCINTNTPYNQFEEENNPSLQQENLIKSVNQMDIKQISSDIKSENNILYSSVSPFEDFNFSYNNYFQCGI
ncbi:hypothetical protein PPERSA_02131 [Pseudocohnilembus persalinus]|uniref:Uncharacterized protein n=1 Tax=Pseudocohnilembus persalinus TaxID=266149 RepID=A0A0V0Q7X8_PSEPJ|nr:hypothetical protein PPERSA_02131 [Pseudocohnilembus persalinus]|eukprot:KRW98354.1 hypothetical protein PPERSA_02131 [Pseudocohnilembus persalinus]